MRRTLFATVAAIGLGAGTAEAGLLGDSIAASYRSPDLATVVQDYGTLLVAPTASFIGLGIFTTTLSDTQIVMNLFQFDSFFVPADFNGLRFENLTEAFGTVTVNAATNMAGFSAANIAVSGNVLTVNWQSLSYDGQTQVILDIGDAPTTVPAPAGLALFGLGLLGLAAARRRA
jgi:hypothetical protein